MPNDGFLSDGRYRTPALTHAVTLSIEGGVRFSRVFTVSLSFSFSPSLSFLLCLRAQLLLSVPIPLALSFAFSFSLTLTHSFLSSENFFRERGSLPVSVVCLTASRSVVTFAQSRDPLSLSSTLSLSVIPSRSLARPIARSLARSLFLSFLPSLSLSLPLSLYLSLALPLSLSGPR